MVSGGRLYPPRILYFVPKYFRFLVPNILNVLLKPLNSFFTLSTFLRSVLFFMLSTFLRAMPFLKKFNQVFCLVHLKILMPAILRYLFFRSLLFRRVFPCQGSARLHLQVLRRHRSRSWNFQGCTQVLFSRRGIA